MPHRQKRPLKERQEEFTFAGFLTVSGWALVLLLQGAFTIPILAEQLSLIEEMKWKHLLYVYGACWAYCFWTMCLIPKIRGEK